MLRSPERPLLPEQAQHASGPCGAIGPPVSRGRRYVVRAALLTGDDWRLWQRRRGRRARRQAEREGS
jgi:hypothetical protein